MQLWHRSNWHWYLKLERRYDDPVAVSQAAISHAAVSAGPAPLLSWDQQAGGKLHVLACGGARYEQLQLTWQVGHRFY